MAATRTKMPTVGSSQWIGGEREQVAQLIKEEGEEFAYSVRNELDWLNEHMADIFTNDKVNFADVFKTPGKLRGKTPRTARKRDAFAPRQPLGDIFAANASIAPPSAHKNAFMSRVAHFEVAEDAEIQFPQMRDRPLSRSRSPQRVGKPGNIDSGYHGITEDEMDVDEPIDTAAAALSTQRSTTQELPLQDELASSQQLRKAAVEAGRASDETFISAKEDLSSRASREQLRVEQDRGNTTVPDDMVDAMEIDEETTAPVANTENNEIDSEMVDQAHVIEEDQASRSPSEASSPEKALQRKSSFTFAALPAREPLTAKHSMGFRESQVGSQTAHNSVLGPSIHGKSMGVAQDDDKSSQQKQGEAKSHQKTTTQLLQERINLLGQTKELRMSKSIPANVLGNQIVYPQLPSGEVELTTAFPAPLKAMEEIAATSGGDEDDWIAPSKPKQLALQEPTQQLYEAQDSSPNRPAAHQKSISTTQIPLASAPDVVADSRHPKAFSVSDISLAHAAGMMQSTTPAGSPKRNHDGPLSASKNKLWSALKSAKNIFASSASASAAAKLEAHKNHPIGQRSPVRDLSDEVKTAAVFSMPGALYSEQHLPQDLSRQNSVVSTSPGRKTRSSTESEKKREKELKAQQKAADELERARDKERRKAAKQQEEKIKMDQAEAVKLEKENRKVAAEVERAALIERNSSKDPDAPLHPPPKSMFAAGKLRAPGRLMRPATQEQPLSKPAPVSIRVASQSQRMGQAPPQSSFSKSQHEGMGSQPPVKQSTLRTASALGSVRNSSAPNNARVKALEAAARKKEADEKAAQKKVEQKRELDRKRAAKVEDERRAEEERKAAEQQRNQEAKLAAQRKAEQLAAEARKREQQRIEQHRQQEEAQRAKAAHDLAEVIKRERAQQPPAHPRGDVGGTLRQVAKNTVPEMSVRPSVQVTAAKPAKRLFQLDDDEPQPQQSQPQRPGVQRGPPSYQQNEAKRRRTNEEDDDRDERHSVMAPPKRPSNMRKESTLSKFPHGYTHAPPPASHHTANIFKATVTAQHQMHHGQKSAVPSHPSQTVQVSNARIPFAENANPPAVAQYTQQTHPGYENAAPTNGNKYKTPVRPGQAPKSARSSPMYPNGDAIQLPEIQTDSEDEASDEDDATSGFRAPSWVASPALRDLLTQQQTVDPESIFGPIGELKMEEVFRNGKNGDRLKRFRDRGSSAAWVESGDAVTSAEKRRDMEGRERVAREGGWRFDSGH